MPKLKTNSGAHKRFKRTKAGRIKRKHAYHRHYLTHKSPKRKRRLRPVTEVSAADRREAARLLPYG